MCILKLELERQSSASSLYGYEQWDHRPVDEANLEVTHRTEPAHPHVNSDSHTVLMSVEPVQTGSGGRCSLQGQREKSELRIKSDTILVKKILHGGYWQVLGCILLRK